MEAMDGENMAWFDVFLTNETGDLCCLITIFDHQKYGNSKNSKEGN